MVRDIIIDMKEHDLSVVDKSDSTLPVFDAVWGNLFDEDEMEELLICNILIPRAYWNIVKLDNGRMTCRFKSEYMPEVSHFRVRLIALNEGNYSLFSNIRGDFGLPVYSYAFSKNIAAPILACQLPYIDIDGEYQVNLVIGPKDVLDKAYIYSSKYTDFLIDFSDNQAARLLSLNGPGKYYRYPLTGVEITKYLNCVVPHSDLNDVLEEQFKQDSKPLKSAEFDNTTCNLDVIFMPEQEEADEGLEDIANLNVGFFDLFTDDYVRRNVVLSEVSNQDFLDLLNKYDYMLGLFLFNDYTTTVERIVDLVVPGAFNGVGDIVENDDYYIVTATLDANTIIMFDDEGADKIKDAPIFIVNDTDETRLYTSLVEQPTWLTESCHKCFILKRRSTIKYMIGQEQFRAGKGLHIVPQLSENIKNMVGLVQDVHTGRLLGIVSDSTNINDITLDEITQHIYATQITD